MPERLHFSVVSALPRAIHAGADTVLFEYGLELVSSVLSPAISVEYKPSWRLTARDSALHYRQSKRHVLLIAKIPCNYLTGVRIHHRCKVHPILTDTNIGQVCHPLLINARYRQVLDQTRCFLKESANIASPFKRVIRCRFTFDIQTFHGLSDRVTTNRMACLAQHLMNPWAAIRTATGAVGGCH